MSVRPPGPANPQLNVSPRGRAIAIAVVVLIVLIQVVPRFNTLYTDWLWFGSVDAQSVMRTELLTRFALFLVVALLIGGAIILGVWLARKYQPVFLPPPGAPDALARYRDALQTTSRWVKIGIPLVIGALAGLVAQNWWQTILAFVHSTPFGSTDPEFGIDIGFFAFQLPFWRFTVTLLLIAIFFTFVANLLTHYLVGGVRPGSREGVLTRAARVQLAVIAGLFVLGKAAAYWLDRYELMFNDHPTFTGASYTDVNAVMPAKIFMFAIALLCAAAFFSAIVLRDLRIPALATALLVFSAVVVGSLWPLAVEQFSVNPNRANQEREYIARNIEATRAAYDIGDDRVEYVDWGGQGQDTDEAASDLATLSNVRVLDPNVLSPTFTQQQQLRNFYGFPETLNIDRYDVDGELRDFVVAARELNPNTLQGNQTDWINRHTVYTHGNGFVAAPANRVNEIADDAGSDRGGTPNYQVADLEALESERETMISVEQPRIYFGELIANSQYQDYAIVGDNGEGPREYDTDTQSYTYTGSGGVPISNFLTRSAYALKFAERNILLSSLIGDQSKIIYDRDPRDRVHKVAPWLTTDSKTYPAVVDGRVKWIVDGYTTVDSFPYAQRASLEDTTADSTTSGGARNMPNQDISYIRNSVKATVDAYDGTVELYQFDEEDPVLETWMKAFPDVVQPKGEISPELQEHLRYPEDLFKVQRQLLAKYQVDDPGQFFTNDAFWSVPSDPTVARSIQAGPAGPAAGGAQGQPGQGGAAAGQQQGSGDDGPAQPPYYVLTADPRTGEPSFQLISAFRGYERQFLSAHMSASSDPETYGQITVRVQRPVEPLPQGPMQAQDIMIASPKIAEDRRLWGETAEITEGNLLALPLADQSMLYVEPIYTQRKDQATAFPRLLRVMVFYNGEVGYAPTLYQALQEVGIDTNPEEVRIDESGAAEAEAEADSPRTTDDQDDQEATAPTTSPSPSPTTTPSPSPAAGEGGGTQAERDTAVRELNEALANVRRAQGSDLADLGQALEELQEAVDAYQALGG